MMEVSTPFYPFTNSNIIIGPTSTTPSPRPDTFLRLCLLWTVLHKTNNIPPACEGVLTEEHLRAMNSRKEFGKLLNSLERSGQTPAYEIQKKFEEREKRKQDSHVRYQFRYTSRSLSLIGVLGGIVLILLIVAMSTCIKSRRNVLLEQQQTNGHENFARQILIDHIRHLSSSRRRDHDREQRDRPPSYDDVVKSPEDMELDEAQNEMQPPSYIEAMEANRSADGGGSATEESHVVTIEVNTDDNETLAATNTTDEDTQVNNSSSRSENLTPKS